MFEIFTLGALASALIAGPAHSAGAEVEFVAGPVASKAWAPPVVHPTDHARKLDAPAWRPPARISPARKTSTMMANPGPAGGSAPPAQPPFTFSTPLTDHAGSSHALAPSFGSAAASWADPDADRDLWGQISRRWMMSVAMRPATLAPPVDGRIV
jgi:hypothetical protein